MTIVQHSWEHPAAGGAAAPNRHARWQPASARTALQAPVWLGLLAALCMFALLLAFERVVSDGVAQGQSRNRAIAAHADGFWRCNILPTTGQRADCHAQLDAAQAATAQTSDRGPATAAAVAQLAR